MRRAAGVDEHGDGGRADVAQLPGRLPAQRRLRLADRGARRTPGPTGLRRVRG